MRPGEFPRLLTPDSCREHGLTTSAVRHGIGRFGWRRLGPGVVLTTGLAPTRHDLVMAGVLLAGRTGAVTGWDAVRLEGIGDSSPPAPGVLLLTADGHHRRFGNIIIRPTGRAYDVRLVYPDEWGGRPLPYVPPARAVADTALTLRAARPVRALVTSAIQRGLCTAEELAAELACGPRNGSGFFRQALEDVFDNAHSVAEAEAVDLLLAEGVPGFELNVPLVGPQGEVLRYADLLWRDLRAVSEIDSREFHYGEDEWQRTTERHNQLTTYGLAIEHDSPRAIRRAGPAWARRIHAWLRNRAHELGVRELPPPGVIRPGPDGPRPFLLISRPPRR